MFFKVSKRNVNIQMPKKVSKKKKNSPREEDDDDLGSSDHETRAGGRKAAPKRAAKKLTPAVKSSRQAASAAAFNDTTTPPQKHGSIVSHAHLCTLPGLENFEVVDAAQYPHMTLKPAIPKNFMMNETLLRCKTCADEKA